MSNKERRERLTKAANLIESVLESLDVARHECVACGIQVRHRPAHWEASHKLMSAVSKAEKVATMIEAAGSHFDDIRACNNSG